MRLVPLLLMICWALLPAAGFAHDLSENNRAFVERIDGPAFVPFLYLGAKHMVTGLDHVLYLIGVVFFLHRLRDVLTYVSLFAAGHSLTLMGGVLVSPTKASKISADCASSGSPSTRGRRCSPSGWRTG
jgi:hypothetical protein